MMVVVGIILMVVAVALGAIGIVLLLAKYFKKDINNIKLFKENIKVRCTSCNELNYENASFCSKCGTKLTK
jgi:rRNA maturation endonuclease Nob1